MRMMFPQFFILLALGCTDFASLHASEAMDDVGVPPPSSEQVLQKIRRLEIKELATAREAFSVKAVVVLDMVDRNTAEMHLEEQNFGYKTQFIDAEEGTKFLEQGNFLGGLHWIGPKEKEYDRKWPGVRKIKMLDDSKKEIVITTLLPVDPSITFEEFTLATKGLDIGRGTEDFPATMEHKAALTRVQSGDVGKGIVLIERRQIDIEPYKQKSNAKNLDFKRVIFSRGKTLYSAVFILPKDPMLQSMQEELMKDAVQVDARSLAPERMKIMMTDAQKADIKRMLQVSAVDLSKTVAKNIKNPILSVPPGKNKQDVIRVAKVLGIKFKKVVTQQEALDLLNAGGALSGVHWVSPGEFKYAVRGIRKVEIGTREKLTVTTILSEDPPISVRGLRTLDAVFPVAAGENINVGVLINGVEATEEYKERFTLQHGLDAVKSKSVGGMVFVTRAAMPRDVFNTSDYNIKRFVYYTAVGALSVLVVTAKDLF